MSGFKPTETVTVEGVLYAVAVLPEEIKAKVAIYDKWRVEMDDARIEMIKLDAAMRDFGTIIAREIQENEAKKNAPDTTGE